MQMSDSSVDDIAPQAASEAQHRVQSLANAIVRTRWDDLPEHVQARALDLVADSLAVMAGGAAHPAMKRLRETVKPSTGACTVLGEVDGANIQDAVLLNSATMTVLQRQDGYSRAKGHPGIQLVAILLAVAEAEERTPKDFLSAFVAGYEAAARIGLSLGGVPDHLHDMGNWVTVGATAGAAYLMCGDDADAVVSAIQGVASVGLHFDRWTTTSGATVHHLYAAVAGVTALNVARGVKAGLSARMDAFESFYVRHLSSDFNPDLLIEGIVDGHWASYEMCNAYFKLHPSCAHLHGANDAISGIQSETDFKEGDVERVDVSLFDEGIAIDVSSPNNDLDARFSAKATVAAAIRFGSLTDEGLLKLDSLQPLMDLINVQYDSSLDKHKPHGRPGKVTVVLKDGRTLSKTVIHPRGTATLAATEQERDAKVRMLLQRILKPMDATLVVEEVRRLPHSTTLDGLTRSLRAAAD